MRSQLLVLFLAVLLALGGAVEAGLISIPAATQHDLVINSTNSAGASDSGNGRPEGGSRDEDWLINASSDLSGSPLSQAPAPANNHYWNTVSSSNGDTGLLIDLGKVYRLDAVQLYGYNINDGSQWMPRSVASFTVWTATDPAAVTAAGGSLLVSDIARFSQRGGTQSMGAVTSGVATLGNTYLFGGAAQPPDVGGPTANVTSSPVDSRYVFLRNMTNWGMADGVVGLGEVRLYGFSDAPVAKARLTPGTPGLVQGAAFAQKETSGEVVGPVSWKVERLVRSPLTTAYAIPAGTVGNQTHGGPLGMDFDLNMPILITELGVFDSGANGLLGGGTFSARLYDRDTQAKLAELIFSGADPGTLVGGSRFKPLATPIELPAGFHGVIVADGYNASEPNFNSFGGAGPSTMNSGGGAISFVGSARWGATPGTFPTNLDGGPANRYGAGTFNFTGWAVGELLGSGTVNVGGPLLDGAFPGIWLSQPEAYFVRMTVDYGGSQAVATATFLGVPEPATCLLLAGGLLALARRRRDQTGNVSGTGQ